MTISENGLNVKERRLLTLLQEDIPLCADPWGEIGRQTGFSAGEVLSRLQRWQAQGMIRKTGPIVSPRALGWFSTLCALKLDEVKLPRFQEYIADQDGITHCYLRDNRQYNVWFTIIAPTKTAANAMLEDIRELFQPTEIQSFPAVETYKIKAVFDLNGKCNGGTAIM